MKLLNFICSSGSWADNGENSKLDCLWCGKHALEVSNEVPHQFQCWSCKQTGNAYTLIQKYYEELPNLTKSQGTELAGWKPGTSPLVFKRCGVRRSTRGYVWPVMNTDGHIVALYRYSKEQNQFYSSPKPCNLSILGLPKLRPEGKIYICEGHWDYAAFLTHAHTVSSSTLGLCGSAWPGKFLSYLEDRDVIFLGDNDDAGIAGVTSLAKRMKKSSCLPASLKYLDWTEVVLSDIERIPEKFDIRDLCVSLYGEDQ